MLILLFNPPGGGRDIAYPPLGFCGTVKHCCASAQGFLCGLDGVRTSPPQRIHPPNQHPLTPNYTNKHKALTKLMYDSPKGYYNALKGLHNG